MDGRLNALGLALFIFTSTRADVVRQLSAFLLCTVLSAVTAMGHLGYQLGTLCFSDCFFSDGFRASTPRRCGRTKL